MQKQSFLFLRASTWPRVTKAYRTGHQLICYAVTVHFLYTCTCRGRRGGEGGGGREGTVGILSIQINF